MTPHFEISFLELLDWRIVIEAETEEAALSEALDSYVTNGTGNFKCKCVQCDYWEVVRRDL